MKVKLQAIILALLLPQLAVADQPQQLLPVYSAVKQAVTSVQAAVDNFKLPHSWQNEVEDIEARLAKTDLSKHRTFIETDCTETASGIHDLQCLIYDEEHMLLRFQFTSHDELLPKKNRNLYVFIYADGRYLGANYTGKLK